MGRLRLHEESWRWHSESAAHEERYDILTLLAEASVSDANVHEALLNQADVNDVMRT